MLNVKEERRKIIKDKLGDGLYQELENYCREFVLDNLKESPLRKEINVRFGDGANPIRKHLYALGRELGISNLKSDVQVYYILEFIMTHELGLTVQQTATGMLIRL